MIKRILLTLSLVSAMVTSHAQSHIIGISPAHNGEKLSMEDAVNNPNMYPKRIYGYWKDNNYIYYSYKDMSYRCFDTKELIFRAYNRNTSDNINIEKEAKFINNGPAFTAFCLDNNLYIIGQNSEKQIVAQSDDPNISYGQSVSRNEFGISTGSFWSNNGRKLAFYKKDESNVTSFPLLDISTRTGSLKSIKYPMNGMASEQISLGVYNTDTGKTIYLDINDFSKERYLSNISWSSDDKYIFVMVLDRSQKNMNLNMYDSNTGKFITCLLKEHNDKFIEPQYPLSSLKSSPYYIYTSKNISGYQNLYLIDFKGDIRRITNVDADVKYIGNDGVYIYYSSAEISPIENHLFRIKVQNKDLSIQDIKFKKPEQLTKERAWHNISLSNDCKYYVDSYSNIDTPNICVISATNKDFKKILISSPNPLAEKESCKVILGKIKSADGKYDNYYRMTYPAQFDSTKTYPVILYVYGGPHSQLVKNSWLAGMGLWEMYMAERGYIVYVQDNRGTENRGRDFENAIHKQCGQVEMADQMEGINMLKGLSYVDKSRIGVHGWSYGGFMTISLLTNYPNTFKVGVAGGPVIDWKWYEVMYGERYMETLETNLKGFEKVSLMNNIDKLKGKLLICQGAIDNTVVWQHSLSFVQKCIEHNVQLDYFPYPKSEHNVYGAWRVHLMNKVSQYFDEYLKNQ